jgi:hypothetical protein
MVSNTSMSDFNDRV